MKKNIFDVFKNAADSDDESAQQKKPEVPKMTKKESRADDKVKREAYGDKVERETPAGKRYHDGPKVKDDYKPGERRPYERHSGTGRQAFGNNFKKGGHGKGNVGGENDVEAELVKDKKPDDGEKKEKAEAPQPEPEPKEEIITLDEFVKKGGFNPVFLQKEEEKKTGPIQITDKTVKVMPSKQKDVETYTKKSSKVEDHVHTKGTTVAIDPLASSATGARNRQFNKPAKQPRVELNDQTFPSLS